MQPNKVCRYMLELDSASLLLTSRNRIVLHIKLLTDDTDEHMDRSAAAGLNSMQDMQHALLL
jgi:hypothetical protein